MGNRGGYNYIKPWTNSDMLVQVRWYKSRSEPIGIPTCWSLPIWEDWHEYLDPGDGEAGVIRHPYQSKSPRSPLTAVVGQSYCGDPAKMASGFDVTVDPQLPVDAFGNGLCCGGVFIYGAIQRRIPEPLDTRSNIQKTGGQPSSTGRIQKGVPGSLMPMPPGSAKEMGSLETPDGEIYKYAKPATTYAYNSSYSSSFDSPFKITT